MDATRIISARRRGARGMRRLWMALFLLPGSAAGVELRDIDFSAEPGGGFEIRLKFDGPPPEPRAYAIERPARIAMDFPGVGSGLDRGRFSLPYGNATGIAVIESGDGTRMVVELVELVPYTARAEGNSLVVGVGNEGAGEYPKPAGDPLPPPLAPAEADSELLALEFQRTEAGEGRLTLTLSDSGVDANVFSEGDRVEIELLGTTADRDLPRRYDVTDFATPVTAIDVDATERGVVLTIGVAGGYDYFAYQTDTRYVVSIGALAEEEVEARNSEFAYVGDSLSLNFQDIEVRAVLQLIADFTELNLVASDTVDGAITLRLRDVPWDQALDLVLKTKGLDKRRVGNVLMVAPAAEIAERERQEIEANRQIAELAPLHTEYMRIRYASAGRMVELFQAGSEEGGTLISPRGSAVVDERTNSLIVTDTAAKLGEIRELIERVDIPIRQVMIEARIVIAQSDVSRRLGIRWGGSHLNAGAGDVFSVSGDLDNTVNLNEAVLGGDEPTLTFPGALLVDLGVAAATGSFAVGYASNDLFLTAELSALEAQGSGEVVSQPKVITGDKQQASIKSGTEVPYQESSSSGETTVSFKQAVLQLDVTPNITPDDRILLDLVINQDSVGDLVPSGTGGSIPTIDTTELATQVLVGNGETVVLGGVFRTEDVESVSKVPFFGDIPYLGRLFRSSNLQQAKTETLIFITPRILADSVLD